MEPVYLRPDTVAQTLEALEMWGDKARLLAGGTDLLVRMRHGVEQPDAIIDISGIAALRHIRQNGDMIEVGALTTYRQIEKHSDGLADWAPVLVAACREVGSVQIRSRGTIGGNLGNASPAGDSLPALYVLDAEVHLLSGGGSRWIPIADFFAGSGVTVRKPDELIAGVRFHPMESGEQSFFLKIGQRQALTIAKVSAAGVVRFHDSVVTRCRLALGAAAPTVFRVLEAEALLTHQPLNREQIGKAAAIAAQACTPIDDIRSTVAYRRQIAGVMVQRGLESCLGG